MIILVVDDEPAIRELVAEIFSIHHDVHLAGDAAGAIEAFDRVHPDITFLDMRLPERAGEPPAEAVGQRALDALLARDPLARIVMISGMPRASEPGRRAIRVGAWGYLEKPFNIGDLRAALVAE